MRLKIGQNVAYQQYACATVRRIYQKTVTLQVWWRAGDMVLPEFRLVCHVPKADVVRVSHLQPEFCDACEFTPSVTVQPKHPYV